MWNNDDDWTPIWFRRKHHPFPSRSMSDYLEEQFKEMHECMQREFQELAKNMPKELMHTRILPDGTKIEEWGPFVYGYTMKIGPDGKPEIREFGNIKWHPKLGKAAVDVRKDREPLVDIALTNGEVIVVVELPGVEKGDIKLHGTEAALTISVENAARSYYKEVKLPRKVEVRKAKSTYKNGVLEVVLPIKSEEVPKGESIKVD